MAAVDSTSLSISAGDENQSLSLADLKTLLGKYAKYKERSYQTCKVQHVPFLNGHPSEPRVVLFGDSMLERMKTTGGCSDLNPWPSEIMLNDFALKRASTSEGDSSLCRIDGVFNAGVGGDKVEHMLYRLLGDSNKGMAGLVSIFSDRNIRLWIVHAGTNNLHQKHGHRDKDRNVLRLLLQTLLRISPSDTTILFPELFYRRDIPDNLVDEANEQLRSLVATMNSNLGRQAIVLIPPPKDIAKDRHLVDHVHLNLKGYQIWAEQLVPRAVGILDEVGNSAEEQQGYLSVND